MAVPSEIERLLPRRRRSTGDLHARRAAERDGLRNHREGPDRGEGARHSNRAAGLMTAGRISTMPRP